MAIDTPDFVTRVQVAVTVENVPTVQEPVTPADAFPTPTLTLPVTGFLMGYDGADWNMLRVDASGHVQVDVLSVPTTDVHLYGYDGANWQRLLVESATYKNLRVRLYDGANGIDSQQVDTHMTTERGLAVAAAIFGRHGAGDVRRTTSLNPANDAIATTINILTVGSFLYGYNGTTWDRLRVDASKNLKVNVAAVDATLSASDSFGGNVYSKTMTMTDDNPTRFETTSKKLRDVVIIVKTNPMLLGETGVEVYPVGASEAVGFTKVDISTLYFKNAGAGNNGTITILGVEE